MKQEMMNVLDTVGIGGTLRSLKRTFRETLAATGMTKWKPLVPADEYTKCIKRSVGRLLEHERSAELGDYLEFGVSRGTSIAAAARAFRELGLHHVRLIGFDSFEGMPDESTGQGWTPGQYKSTLGATKRYIASNGVDMDRVVLVKGWFNDTLNDKTRQDIAVKKASVIMVDCDIYTASKQALDFALPYVADRAIVLFDDWGGAERRGIVGQKEVWDEFKTEHPEFKVMPLEGYADVSRVFLIERV
jgi:hypothetical protein